MWILLKALCLAINVERLYVRQCLLKNTSFAVSSSNRFSLSTTAKLSCFSNLLRIITHFGNNTFFSTFPHMQIGKTEVPLLAFFIGLKNEFLSHAKALSLLKILLYCSFKRITTIGKQMPEGRILFAATSSLDAIVWTVTKKKKTWWKDKIELKSDFMFELITYFVQGKFYDNHHTLAHNVQRQNMFDL